MEGEPRCFLNPDGRCTTVEDEPRMEDELRMEDEARTEDEPRRSWVMTDIWHRQL
jgi:hypothetical protein